MNGLYMELKGILKANGFTQHQYARAIHVAPSTMDTRFQGVQPWALDEMYHTLDLFRIPHNQLHLIFPPDGKAESASSNTTVSSIPHVIRVKFVLKEIEELD